VAEAHGGTLDLVITDVVMPHLGGPELVAELRAQRETLPALFVSGYPNRYGGETSLPGLFLAKPFTRGELLEAVDSLLAAGRSGRRVS
jgi:hypothetical protein